MLHRFHHSVLVPLVTRLMIKGGAHHRAMPVPALSYRVPKANSISNNDHTRV